MTASWSFRAGLSQCLVSDGCVIGTGTRVTHSVIGVRTRIGRDAVIRDTVLIGADRLESDAERAVNRSKGIPDLGVGDGSVIERLLRPPTVR